MQPVVLHGYHNAEQLALTEQLSDAALGELSVVARGQPCLVVGTSTWSPPKSLAWQKGFRLGSGLIWKLLLLASVLGTPRAGSGEILWLVALLRLLLSPLVGWSLLGGFYLILLLELNLIVVGGPAERLSLCSVLLCGLLLGCLLLSKVGVPSRWRSTGSGRSMMIVCSSCQGMMHFCWMSPCEWVLCHVRGWSGLGMLRLRLLTLTGLLEALFR